MQFDKTLSPEEAKQALLDYAVARKYDPSFLAIVGGNILTIFIALGQGWALSDVMWIYWGQSVLIGVMNFFRMWNLKKFSTKGLTSNGKPVPATKAGARSIALFFAVHYGIFHLAYMGFLFADEGFNPNIFDLAFIALSLLIFFASHLFSLSRNIQPDLTAPTPNLGTIMFMPYLRIIPMHITIVLGLVVFENTVFGVVFFMTLKTFADGATHMIEHFIYQKGLKRTD